MKVYFDNKLIYELSDLGKKVWCSYIPESQLELDIRRRVMYWLKIPVINKAEKLRKKHSEYWSSSTESIMRQEAEKEPPKFGIDDILPIQGQVGSLRFNLSVEYQIGWRLLLFLIQSDIEDKDEYLFYERQLLEDRIIWILNEKTQKCMERLRNEWMNKISDRHTIPEKDAEFADLVFNHPDYKSREEQLAEDANEQK